jgi:hypothetical protein
MRSKWARLSSFALKLNFGLFISTTLRYSYTEVPSSERSINSRPSCIIHRTLFELHPPSNLPPSKGGIFIAASGRGHRAYQQYLCPAYGIFRHAVDTPRSGSTASNPHSWDTFLDLVTSPTSCTQNPISRGFLSSCQLVKISSSAFALISL